MSSTVSIEGDTVTINHLVEDSSFIEQDRFLNQVVTALDINSSSEQEPEKGSQPESVRGGFDTTACVTADPYRESEWLSCLQDEYLPYWLKPAGTCLSLWFCVYTF